MSFNLQNIIRDNIKNLAPYSSARDEFSGEANVFLDANENSLGSPVDKDYSRYPDPHQLSLKAAIAKVKNVAASHIFLGNGSDECIDVIFRCFAHPGSDNTIVCPPTYGMYQVSADINDVEVRKAPLTEDFQLDAPAILALVDDHTKIIWICSPNNPSGNLLSRKDIENILRSFDGIVVVDEAYNDFSTEKSFNQSLAAYPNLIVMQTFSKAWGLAGLRLGLAFASEEILSYMNKVKPPYNINIATQEIAMQAVRNVEKVQSFVAELDRLRQSLAEGLAQLPIVEKIFPSDANFLLVRVRDAKNIYADLLTEGIVVRDRHNVLLCRECLRITVGTKEENETLLRTLQKMT